MSIDAGYGKLLCEKPFRDMFSEFSAWRLDQFVRAQEKRRSKGRILPFVRGLRLSAHIIYAVREILEGSDLTANWGHLLDEKRTLCSCECDVIVHKNGHVEKWNGGEKPIMDFRFIDKKDAVLVISCKSLLKTDEIDREYSELMKPFVDKIWLFAECCGPKSLVNIKKAASDIGYEKFWALYTWSKKCDVVPNREQWNDFVKEIETLKTNHSSTKQPQ
jgi:hypothetical protein